MLQEFYKLKDEKQASFSKKLTPTNIPFLGIKIPLIKEFVKTHDITYDDLKKIPLNKYVEQDILYGLFLNKLGKIKDDEYYNNFLWFTKYLDNWMTCDTFVCNTKFSKKDYDKLLNIIKDLFTKEAIQIRCGLILLMKYFIKELPFDEIFRLIKDIKYGEYYIDMGCAWLIATMAAYDFEYIYNHLDDIYKMSTFVHKKAVQKMRESYRITDDQKKLLKAI